MEVKCTVNWEQYLTQDIVDDMVIFITVFYEFAVNDGESFQLVCVHRILWHRSIRPDQSARTLQHCGKMISHSLKS